jgi:predicted 3-demethylubiquinone-9 3-methyltransferase (glyoxalase superfamily)
VQNRAEEALQHYAQVFPNSRLGQLARYPEQTGPAVAGALMYGDVELGGSWLAAMDSAVPQDVTFTPAVSFMVPCDSQAEIDELWSGLSEVPEAEACGWCQDRFGVSWQITPADVEELLKRPGAYQHMLTMKKLVIDEF